MVKPNTSHVQFWGDFLDTEWGMMGTPIFSTPGFSVRKGDTDMYRKNQIPKPSLLRIWGMLRFHRKFRVCVCVNHLKRCKTSTADFIRFYSISCRGAVNLIPSTAQRRRWFEIVISDIGTDHPDVPANFQFPFCRQWQPAKPRTGMSIFCRVSRFTALLSQSVFLSCQ